MRKCRDISTFVLTFCHNNLSASIQKHSWKTAVCMRSDKVMQWFPGVFHVGIWQCITSEGHCYHCKPLISSNRSQCHTRHGSIHICFITVLQGGKAKQTSDCYCADSLFSLEPTALHSVFPPVYKHHGTLHCGRTLPINLCLSSAEPRTDTSHMLQLQQHFQSQPCFYITFHLYLWLCFFFFFSSSSLSHYVNIQSMHIRTTVTCLI